MGEVLTTDFVQILSPSYVLLDDLYTENYQQCVDIQLSV